MKLDKAIHIAAAAHLGQKDRGGQPYIIHPITVMMHARARGYSESVQVVCVLHDVVEDTPITLEELKEKGLTSPQYHGLDSVTRKPGETKRQAVHHASLDPIGNLVKELDLRHNLDVLRLGKLMTPKDMDRVNEYIEALDVILHARPQLREH